ncbi:unnamed protein product [marine sediment metagenome]|uniref:YgiT-type zinc finger domain-containing protein n=1 Tax=marine sediment metagenome TaxID=412755 RepID=X0S7M0_9ZZZZ
MAAKYGDCHYCGGKVTERKGEREYRWKGKMVIFQNVPMGVCLQCGEKYLKARVVRKMESAVLSGEKPDKTMRVPVYSYAAR